MARDKRPNGRNYYYSYVGRRRRTNTAVRSYLGTGPVAAYLALLDAEQRAARRKRVAAEQRERQRILAARKLTDHAISAVRHFMTIGLGALGYHQHSRGIWRKRRDEAAAGDGPCQDGAIQTTQPDVDSHATTRVNDCAWSCRPLELVNQAIACWLELLDWSNPAQVDQLPHQIQETCTAMLEQGDSELEQVCIGRVLLCFVQIQVIGLLGLNGTGLSEAHLKFLRRRGRAAERQLATAKAVLATVRRLIQREAERYPTGPVSLQAPA